MGRANTQHLNNEEVSFSIFHRHRRCAVSHPGTTQAHRRRDAGTVRASRNGLDRPCSDMRQRRRNMHPLPRLQAFLCRSHPPCGPAPKEQGNVRRGTRPTACSPQPGIDGRDRLRLRRQDHVGPSRQATQDVPKSGVVLHGTAICCVAFVPMPSTHSADILAVYPSPPCCLSTTAWNWPRPATGFRTRL
jgi:hypothetical protein